MDMHHATRNEALKAVCFFIFLIAATLTFTLTAFSSSGPIILGTELNTNGLVEYLCLGNGCETLQDFHWADK